MFGHGRRKRQGCPRAMCCQEGHTEGPEDREGHVGGSGDGPAASSAPGTVPGLADSWNAPSNCQREDPTPILQMRNQTCSPGHAARS